MFPTRSLLQAVAASSSSSAKYIPHFSTTGITGLASHPFPRPILIGLYTHTLHLLSTLPPHSLYRTSTENLTKSRLSIVESTTPPNYDSYLTTIQPLKQSLLETLSKTSPTKQLHETDLPFKSALAAAIIRASVQSTTAHLLATETSEDDLESTTVAFESRLSEIEQLLGAIPDALPVEYQRRQSKQAQEQDQPPHHFPPGVAPDQATSHETTTTTPPPPPPGKQTSPPPPLPEFPPEPPLTADQVADIESKIGAGLIEEVINQGLAELKVIQEMKKYKPWEDLEEAPAEGQWSYFERKP